MDEYRSYGQKSVDGGSKWRAGMRKPRLGWTDGVKVNRGMTVEAARKIGKSGEPWYICN